MLEVKELPRVFLFKHDGQELRLTDPEPSFTEEDVLNFYSPTYPALTTARVEGPVIEGDEIQYKFVTTIGTKG
jgi:PRTRC genetic system protein C